MSAGLSNAVNCRGQRNGNFTLYKYENKGVIDFNSCLYKANGGESWRMNNH